jgi:hypothetical protein
MTGPADGAPEGRAGGGRPPGPRRRVERLVAVLVAAVVTLNFPFIDIARKAAPVAGIPALYVYLFSVWALVIGAAAFILRGRPEP